MDSNKAVTSIHPAAHDRGITLRQAALIAGLGVLVMGFTAPFAESFVYPKLVVAGKIQDTVRNILAHQGLFLAGIFCYLITLICDVLVAWAYYVLLAPVSRSLSMLAAWFRLLHAVTALSGLLKLVTAFRLLSAPDYLEAHGVGQLHAQVQLLLNSFRYEYSFSLVFFGIHLGLLGYLVHRSGYIPRILGTLLAIAGSGFLIYCLAPYLFRGADLGFLMITFLGEMIFMLWLLVRGRRIQDPTDAARRTSIAFTLE